MNTLETAIPFMKQLKVLKYNFTTDNKTLCIVKSENT